jgi:hypothetical protein
MKLAIQMADKIEDIIIEDVTCVTADMLDDDQTSFRIEDPGFQFLVMMETRNPFTGEMDEQCLQACTPENEPHDQD